MLYQALLLLAAIAYLEVSRRDLRSRRIPNALSVFIAVLACIRLIMIGHLADIGWSVFTAVVLFTITSFFFARGWLGGGDVKLITVSSLLIGYQHVYQFLVYMALAGGILSIIIMLNRLLKHKQDDQKSTVPYGIAISLSAMFVLMQQYRQGLG